MKYYLEALKNYAQFSGRARRKEYWYFALFNLLIYYVLVFVGATIRFPAIAWIYYIGTLIPYIAVTVRRMHDVDKSGWFCLIPIYNLILSFTEGTHGDNEYGPDPKGGTGFGADDYQKPFDAIDDDLDKPLDPNPA
jgi:uncharacterized membrane protein YhaH (DUF805 family)